MAVTKLEKKYVNNSGILRYFNSNVALGNAKVKKPIWKKKTIVLS